MVKDNVDWIKIQKQFDEKRNDINELFYFLREIVDELQICNSSECKIFPEIHELDLEREDFDYPSILEAKKFLNEIELDKFKFRMKEFVRKCKSAFSKIFALKTSQSSQEDQHNKKQQWFMEIIREMNKSKMPFPIEFQKAVQGQIDELSFTLTHDDPNLVKEQENFKKQMEEQKREVSKQQLEK